MPNYPFSLILCCCCFSSLTPSALCHAVCCPLCAGCVMPFFAIMLYHHHSQCSLPYLTVLSHHSLKHPILCYTPSHAINPLLLWRRIDTPYESCSEPRCHCEWGMRHTGMQGLDRPCRQTTQGDCIALAPHNETQDLLLVHIKLERKAPNFFSQVQPHVAESVWLASVATSILSPSAAGSNHRMDRPASPGKMTKEDSFQQTVSRSVSIGKS